MPNYECVFHDCKKHFSKILSMVDYGEREVHCPHCGSKESRTMLVRLHCSHVEEERLTRISHAGERKRVTAKN